MTSSPQMGSLAAATEARESAVLIPLGSLCLEGTLTIPSDATAVVLFAHGSGSSRHSPRNRFVAQVLRDKGIGTLLFDLLTVEEDLDSAKRFDIALLTKRLESVTTWLAEQGQVRDFRFGYFGASTGAAAALWAAAEVGDRVGAVVSRGGRPDLAMAALHRVQAPTLLIVGGLDRQVIQLNRQALAKLRTEKELAIIPGASHLFEEPGTLGEVARLASEWFERHLGAAIGHD